MRKYTRVDTRRAKLVGLGKHSGHSRTILGLVCSKPDKVLHIRKTAQYLRFALGGLKTRASASFGAAVIVPTRWCGRVIDIRYSIMSIADPELYRESPSQYHRVVRRPQLVTVAMPLVPQAEPRNNRQHLGYKSRLALHQTPGFPGWGHTLVELSKE